MIEQRWNDCRVTEQLRPVLERTVFSTHCAWIDGVNPYHDFAFVPTSASGRKRMPSTVEERLSGGPKATPENWSNTDHGFSVLGPLFSAGLVEQRRRQKIRATGTQVPSPPPQSSPIEGEEDFYQPSPVKGEEGLPVS